MGCFSKLFHYSGFNLIFQSGMGEKLGMGTPRGQVSLVYLLWRGVHESDSG